MQALEERNLMTKVVTVIATATHESWLFIRSPSGIGMSWHTDRTTAMGLILEYVIKDIIENRTEDNVFTIHFNSRGRVELIGPSGAGFIWYTPTPVRCEVDLVRVLIWDIVSRDSVLCRESLGFVDPVRFPCDGAWRSF